MGDNADESDDEDDHVIKPSDSVILVGKTEEEHSSLEVLVFSEADSTLYVHHDFTLPSFPLSLAWMDVDPRDGSTGSFVAVGTFHPGIEVWNLDVIDNMEPVAVLGGRLPPDEEKISNLKKKCKKDKKHKETLKEAMLGAAAPGAHRDAVMCLAWHKAFRTRLASGSADCTIKVWDVVTKEAAMTLTHHTSKVQSIEWNPSEPTLLLSGAFDRTIALCDIRKPENVQKCSLDSDLECVKWCPTQPFLFLASTESGTVTMRDARRMETSIFTLSAHTKPCTSLSWNVVAGPPMFATASIDKTVKLWELNDSKPSLITSRDVQGGSLFCLSFACLPGSPFMLCAGGSGGDLAVWDTMEDESVDSRYGKLGYGSRNANVE
jgi:periodic tryptophan protein 1